MRLSIGIVAVVLLLSGFGIAQTTPDYWQVVPYPGAYASPFVPQISTPEVQFATPPLQVGATNATAGNVVGASNSTVETLNSASAGSFSSSVENSLQSNTGSTVANGQNASLDMGASILEESVGVAALAAPQSNHQHASRTYTNDDVERLKSASER
jgi:hypothetical protein